MAIPAMLTFAFASSRNICVKTPCLFVRKSENCNSFSIEDSRLSNANER